MEPKYCTHCGKLVEMGECRDCEPSLKSNAGDAKSSGSISQSDKSSSDRNLVS